MGDCRLACWTAGRPFQAEEWIAAIPSLGALAKDATSASLGSYESSAAVKPDSGALLWELGNLISNIGAE
jgi:hypothetical protein